jgi:hypothetical protein
VCISGELENASVDKDVVDIKSGFDNLAIFILDLGKICTSNSTATGTSIAWLDTTLTGSSRGRRDTVSRIGEHCSQVNLFVSALFGTTMGLELVLLKIKLVRKDCHSIRVHNTGWIRHAEILGVAGIRLFAAGVVTSKVIIVHVENICSFVAKKFECLLFSLDRAGLTEVILMDSSIGGTKATHVVLIGWINEVGVEFIIVIALMATQCTKRVLIFLPC